MNRYSLGSQKTLSELCIKKDERIKELEKALQDLINTACECDGWESFPSEAIKKAEAVLPKG